MNQGTTPDEPGKDATHDLTADDTDGLEDMRASSGAAKDTRLPQFLQDVLSETSGGDQLSEYFGVGSGDPQQLGGEGYDTERLLEEIAGGEPDGAELSDMFRQLTELGANSGADANALRALYGRGLPAESATEEGAARAGTLVRFTPSEQLIAEVLSYQENDWQVNEKEILAAEAERVEHGGSRFLRPHEMDFPKYVTEGVIAVLDTFASLAADRASVDGPVLHLFKEGEQEFIPGFREDLLETVGVNPEDRSEVERLLREELTHRAAQSGAPVARSWWALVLEDGQLCLRVDAEQREAEIVPFDQLRWTNTQSLLDDGDSRQAES